MTILIIKRRDLGGYEEITCQSCSCRDPKYSHVYQQLSEVLILLLQREKGSLMITTKNTTQTISLRSLKKDTHSHARGFFVGTTPVILT